MPKGNPQGNPDILMAAAEAKRQDALNRTKQALAELVNSGADITFKSVAEKAGVSVPYLYKYEDLKQQIQHLRNQQKQTNRKRKPKPQLYQPASDKSRTVVNENLKEVNKRLRSDIDSQKAQIKAMAGRLSELSGVEEENLRLKQQLQRVTAQLHSTQVELKRYLLNNPTAHPKVTAIDAKKSILCSQENYEVLPSSISNDQLAEMLTPFNVKIVPKLLKIAEKKSKRKIENTLLAVEEYISTGKPVKSKMGLILKAIEEEWEPNLSESEREIIQADDNFSEWFKLAQQKGLVLASQGTEDGIILLEKDSNKWTSWKDMRERGITLEFLKKSKYD